jgi:gliding motility-associated-like protein
MKNKILLLLAIFSVSSLTAQTPNNCGNYTTTGSVMVTGYTDPNPACGANVPGTVGSGPAYWDGASCGGQLISTVVGAPVSCLTLAYTAVNTDDYATITTNTGGVLTITAVNCGVSGSVIGPYNCGTGFYGTCGITVCSTVPFTQVILTNTGCSSGWVIDCGTPTVSCTNPVITPEPDLVYCAGNAVPLNSFVSTPGGATFTWTNSNPSIGLAASGSGSVPAFTATNLTGAPITATITVTATSGACTGTDVYTITVNPQATANANIDQVICQGGTINLAGIVGGGATSGTWSAPSGVFSNPASLTSTYTPSITSGTVTLTLTTNDPAGPCPAVTDQMVVTVNPAATVNANIDQTVCQGGTINLAGTIGGGATSATWSAPSGTFSNASSLTSTYTPTITSGTVTLTLTTNDPVGPCLAVTDQMIVTVNPQATVNANIDQTICAGGTITLAGSIGGGATSGTWSAPSGTFSNVSSLTSTYTPTITSGTVTLTLTTNDPLGPCNAVTDQMVVTVTPGATANANVDQVICQGGTITLAGSIGGAATSSTWSAPSGTFSNPASLTSTYTPTIASGTVTLTLTTDDPAGSCTAVTDQMIVTVNPLATVNANIDQTVCAGGTITLAGVIGGGASSATWSAPSGTFSNASSLTSTYTPTITSGTVTLTLTTNDPAGPCLAVTDQLIVTVNQPATANANVDQTICAGGTINLAGSIGGGASSSTWSAPSGTFSNASSLTSTYTPTIASGTVTLTLTTNDPAGPCPAVTDAMVVTVNPVPAFALAGVDPTSCGGSDGTITISGLSPTTTYAVTYTNGGIVGPVNMTSNGLGNIVIAGLPSGTYTGFTLTLTGCTGTSPAVIVLSDPSAPVVGAGADQTVCEGTAVTLTANNPDGAIISWTNSVTDGVAFTPAVGTITYTVQANLAGCISTDQVNITVNPIPTVNDPANQVLCENSVTTAVDFTGALPGTMFDWTNNDITIGLAANGTDDIPSFTAQTPGVTVTATITVIPTLAGCTGTPQTFTIMVIQSTPSLTCPGNLTATCSITEQPPYPSFAAFTGAGGSASSVGSVIVPSTFTLVSEVSDGLTCPETVTRTYSIEDTCGNLATCTQTIIVDDNINPTGTAPANIAVQCIGDVPAFDVTLITDEADNCGVPSVTFISDVSDGNTCPETITRTYRITDACGNFIDVTQTILVDDTTNPTASNPASVTVDIIANVPAPDPLVVIDEADNCSVPMVAFVSDVSDGNACPETITRTYSVTDACGNQITVTQTIIVSDMIMPTASNPAGVNVQCIAQVPAPDVLVVTDEADNNGVPVVAFVSDVSDGNTCPETITRTYSVTDPCGNQILVTQPIIVNDITDPTASNPPGIVVQCIALVPAANPAVVFDEADNCTANPVVAFVSDVSDGNACPETITRTYSVTDDCGNSINVTQTIIVDDTTNPTASNPAGVTVQCIAQVPAPDAAVVTDEADNCAVPVVAFVSDVTDGNTCPETITRTYSVTDACGNSINVTQTIIVNDTTNPTASNPATINVTCASAVPAPDPTVVTTEADNCTVNPVVAFVSDVSDGNVCNNETITRTYSITDNCGNSINVTQQIVIGVTTPTVLAGADQSVCEGTLVTLTAGNPDVAFISWDNAVVNGSPFSAPVGTTTYTVTATQCGGECVSTDQVDVTVYPLPAVDFVADVTLGCDPLPVTFTNLTVPSGSDCTWNFGDGNSGSGCTTVSNTYMNAGVYDVSLTVTSPEGCTSSVTYADYVTVVATPIAAFTATPTTVPLQDTEVEFENESMYADSYYWNFGDDVSSPDINPSHVYPLIGNMEYTVELIASNYLNCTDTAYLQIIVEDEILFYVPNIFTPDNDDINNTFFPVFTSGYDIYDYHLTILNRWGEVLFESYDATVGWTGTYGDQGLVEDAVYIWQIEFGETMSDKRHTHRGHVTVLK